MGKAIYEPIVSLNYAVSTIRPAHYPNKYQGRFIPAHIHFNVSANGYQDLRIQMVFDDDVVMKDQYWRDWAKNINYPIILLHKQGETFVGVHNFVLTKQ